MDAIEAGYIEPSSLSRSSITRLVRHSDKEISSRTEIVFADLLTNNREDVIKEYFESTTMEGNIANGKSVFEQTCSICHQTGGDEGNSVGPDLRSVSDRTRVHLLSIINSNI